MPELKVLDTNIFRPVNSAVYDWLSDNFLDSTAGLYGQMIHHLKWAVPDRAFSYQDMHDSAGQPDLPIMSFYLETMEEMQDRRCIPSLLSKYNNPAYDKDLIDGTSIIKLFVKPYKFVYNIAFWTDQREELERIITVFKYNFAPQIVLYPEFYEGKIEGFYATLYIESSNDLSNLDPGEDITVYRYQVNLACEVPLPLMAGHLEEIRRVVKNYYSYTSDSTALLETTYTPEE